MATKIPKVRLDRLLLEKGLVSSHEKARALIYSGLVRVNHLPADKPGKAVDPNLPIEIKQPEYPYVSRGGVKLEKALKDFGVIVQDKVALDIGASTGGFSHCLLLGGIRRLYAIDVGYGQLAWEVRQDPRVKVWERKNVRYLSLDEIGEQPDLIVIDTSFISLRLVVPPLIPILKDQGEIVALIKPQFEVGKGRVGKGGVVRNEEDQKGVIESLSLFFIEQGLSVLGTSESPIQGAKGNREFFIHLQKGGQKT
ncbi:MAG: TlyA family rRNA (cytidine-2'-O)-methyltransferase [Desulfobacca sp.]|nr:TlyA family rRNA (cytidine-2'-O)-methyltransferase [Desulfobacca sp.]